MSGATGISSGYCFEYCGSVKGLLTMIRRTNPPTHYIEPSDKEVIQRAEEQELKSFSIPLVRDIANIAAGGSYVDYEEIIREVGKSVKVVKASDGDYMDEETGNYLKHDGSYINSYGTAVKVASKEKADYHVNVSDFIRNLEFNRAAGNTPLQKAVNIVNMLANQKQNKGGDCSEEKGKGIPIFSNESDERTSGTELGKRFNEIFEQMTKLDSPEKDLMQSDDMTDVHEQVDDRELGKMALASEMLKGKDIWFKISRKLESLTNFKTRSFKKTIPSVDGTSVRTRAIEHPGEINKLTSSEWTNPKSLRLFRIVSRQAQIRERVNTVDQKQLLYLLIDHSGSMRGDDIHKAGGVLMNRLKAVIKGEAQVFVRFFADYVGKEYMASTPEEAKQLMNHFQEHNFDGGGTEIVKSLKVIRDDINKKMKADELLVRPEVVIVTDGQDDVSRIKAKDFKPTVVHGIVINGKNDDLAKFCRATGGVVIQRL